jgi:branched-chain amino acid transport system permease protein
VNTLATNLVTAVDGVAFGLLLFTLAVGLSLVFGMMDVLNLAHGTLYLVGAYAAYWLSDGSWWGLALAVVVGTVAGALGGGVLAGMTLPLSRRGHLDQALLTLGVAFIAAELFFEAFGAVVVPTAPPEALRGGVELFGRTYPVYRLVFIAVAGLLAIAVYIGFERSSIGALVRATVADREMVQAMGVDTRRVLFGVFAVGAGLAAFGGALGAPLMAPGPGVDERVLILSLVVVVIGGLGSVRGALLGALLIGQVQTLGVSLLPDLAPFLLFGAMLTVLVLRPRGLVPVGERA